MPNKKYSAYFEIDGKYFPQVNEASIAASPDSWKQTYPHHTFIEMLNTMERLLGRREMRSLWIEGAYGTGKSQCAYALKKILDAPEVELRAYWEKYDPLKNNADLLERLIGHKKQGVVTAIRFSSGDIFSPKELFLSLQDTLKEVLKKAELYEGENTLKEGAIAWLEEPAQKDFFDALLKKPEWSALFSQSNADEVLKKLHKGGDVRDLMGNIFRLASKEGITAMNIDVDKLIAWLTDVIDKNNVKIVFIWDEFSDYFRNNRESLSVFQKLAELVSDKPFFLVVVTHETGQLFPSNETTWKKVRDRFVPSIITLPDNIAFDLIGEAFSKKTAAMSEWDKLADDLNARVHYSRQQVMDTAKIKDDKVIKKIMPLHPMAALLLKNIASAFQSNQRSMFNFIKSDTESVKAFQWFIENAGPHDEYPLLTVDMLWDFFYERDKDNLTADIRLILDTYQHQAGLATKEQIVLKAILIMQAIDQRLGGNIELFKATEQNLKYVFEGVSSGLETEYRGIAKGLLDKGILVLKPFGKNHAYSVAVLAGDQSKIDDNKKKVRRESTTAKLVTDGNLASLLSLSPALKLRFEAEPDTGKLIPVTTATEFTREVNLLRDMPPGWKFHAVIAFAKDDSEAFSLREKIRAAALEMNYEHIVFIDALSTPLGEEAFESYVEHQAMALYHGGSNKATSRESEEKARRVLDQEWKNRIYNGQFIVYSTLNKEGEKVGNAVGVESILKTIVASRFKYAFDFVKGLTENQMKLTTMVKPSAKCGVTQNTSGVVVGVEKHVLPSVWKVDNYWENPSTSSLTISKIKIELEALMEAAFARDGAGQISIDEIYDFLEKKYGFPPCNLSAFLTGFLLKEYGSEPYRYRDESGAHESMTPDKLAEMIGNYINHIGKTGKAGKAPKRTYIVKITAEEMAFYRLTEKAWGLKLNSCSSVSQAATAVSKEMSKIGLPVWSLKELDEPELFDAVQKYIDLVQREKSADAQKTLAEIGRMASQRPTLGENLSSFINKENCKKGIEAFLKSFEDGRIPELARSIGAEANVIEDIRTLFDVKHSALWDEPTGEDEIRKLLTEYGVVKETNNILNSSARSIKDAFKAWREKLQFLGISHEALRSKYSALAGLFNLLFKMHKHEDLLYDQLKAFHADILARRDEIRELFNNDATIFATVYSPYLEGLGEGGIAGIKNNLPHGLFGMPQNTCNARVKEVAEKFRKDQLKTQLFNLWKEKTGTKSPHDWSDRFKTPILCCVSEPEYSRAKKVFETLNKNMGTDTEIKEAIAYLETTRLFEALSDERARKIAFERGIIGRYKALLPNSEAVRETLEGLSVDIYDWQDHPDVKGRVKQLAQAEYNAGGSDRALVKIDGMDDAQLKSYLKQLVKESMIVGIEILADGGKQ